MAEFNVGDVVQLKSGGPSMTVTQVGEKGGTLKVFCTWFDKTGERKYGSFEPDTVETLET